MPDTLPAISDETKEMIEDHVKKGKARKFFLISKGANITTLEVFKKGPFGPRVMKAKKEGFKGEVTYGVVTGSGKELYFQLAGNEAVAEAMKVDSFAEKPPTKRSKLRDFLNENGLSFKCNYYLITNLSDAPDPEGESTVGPPPASALAPDDELGEAPSAETEEEEEGVSVPPTAPPSATNLFTERLKAIKPAIDEAIAAQSQISAELKSKVTEAALLARDKNFDQANALLDQVEELLKGDIPVPPPAPSESQIPPQAPPQADDASAQFNKRFGELVSQIKQAGSTPTGETIKLKASEAGALARKKDFDRANALLDEVEELLEKGATGPSAMEEWKTARGEVVKQLHALGKAIAATDDPEAKDAIILIKAIAANLTEKPETLKQVDELERYLVTDDIIESAEEENGFGIDVRLRETLMPVLERLKEELSF